jgi:hypothetical protein
MNANELADKQAFELGELSMWTRNETAAMLRQQQAEIEHLKELFGCDPAYYERSAKTLTDEEIEKVAQALIDDRSYCALHFARAILRKAQEK